MKVLQIDRYVVEADKSTTKDAFRALHLYELKGYVLKIVFAISA